MKCTACAGSGEDFNEGDPCTVCGGSGDSSKPGPHVGESLALRYLREKVAKDMQAFYNAFGIRPPASTTQHS